jgi:hypothetical protein
VRGRGRVVQCHRLEQAFDVIHSAYPREIVFERTVLHSWQRCQMVFARLLRILVC